jgi:hypothetical protein
MTILFVKNDLDLEALLTLLGTLNSTLGPSFKISYCN